MSKKVNNAEALRNERKNNVVVMMFEIDTVDNKKIVDVYQFELSRLWNTINWVNKVDDIKQHRRELKAAINDFLSGKFEKDPRFQAMLKQEFNSDMEEYMRTLMINWVSTYDSPKKWLNDSKNKSISIVAIWDAKNEEDPKIVVSDNERFMIAYDLLNKEYNLTNNQLIF